MCCAVPSAGSRDEAAAAFMPDDVPRTPKRPRSGLYDAVQDNAELIYVSVGVAVVVVAAVAVVRWWQQRT